MLGAKMGVSMI